jgi:hypothetical protein
VSEGGYSYLADVDQAAHQVPVTKSVDGGLRLVLGGVLDNAASLAHAVRELENVCVEDGAGCECSQYQLSSEAE